MPLLQSVFYQSKKEIRNTKEKLFREPGVIYNFTNQSLISYEDNFKAKGDIPFAVCLFLFRNDCSHR